MSTIGRLLVLSGQLSEVSEIEDCLTEDELKDVWYTKSEIVELMNFCSSPLKITHRKIQTWIEEGHIHKYRKLYEPGPTFYLPPSFVNDLLDRHLKAHIGDFINYAKANKINPMSRSTFHNIIKTLDEAFVLRYYARHEVYIARRVVEKQKQKGYTLSELHRMIGYSAHSNRLRNIFKKYANGNSKNSQSKKWQIDDYTATKVIIEHFSLEGCDKLLNQPSPKTVNEAIEIANERNRLIKDKSITVEDLIKITGIKRKCIQNYIFDNRIRKTKLFPEGRLFLSLQDVCDYLGKRYHDQLKNYLDNRFINIKDVKSIEFISLNNLNKNLNKKETIRLGENIYLTPQGLIELMTYSITKQYTQDCVGQKIYLPAENKWGVITQVFPEEKHIVVSIGNKELKLAMDY